MGLPSQVAVQDERTEGDSFMIDEINIHHFRCFKQLQITDLKKLNLVVGPNASGKSALMEAIFLSSGPFAASTALQLRAIRRMGNQLQSPTDIQSYKSIWEDLFYDFNSDERVSIKVAGNPNSDSRNLWIEYVTPLAQELPFGKQSTASSIQEVTVMPQIQFKWKRTGYPEVLSKPKFTSTGLQVEMTAATYFPSLWFSPGTGETPEENAKRFSDLDKRGVLGPVLGAIKKEFPIIENLSIQYQAGMPILFATIKGSSRKVPVPLISDGVNRLVGICLGIGYFKGGTVLIDELEDGFHHTILPSIWRSIYDLSKEYDVQLFVSTHSKECMDALLPTVKDNEADFRLLRAHRKDKECQIQSLDGTYLQSALEQEFEVR